MSMNVNTSYQDPYNHKTDELKDRLENYNLTTTSDDELMAVCEEFEAYFVEQMFKALEKTVMKNEDDESSASLYTDYFGDMRTQEYAKLASKSSDLGLAQMLYEQLKVNVQMQLEQAIENGEQAAEAEVNQASES